MTEKQDMNLEQEVAMPNNNGETANNLPCESEIPTQDSLDKCCEKTAPSADMDSFEPKVQVCSHPPYYSITELVQESIISELQDHYGLSINELEVRTGLTRLTILLNLTILDEQGILRLSSHPHSVKLVRGASPK